MREIDQLEQAREWLDQEVLDKVAVQALDLTSLTDRMLVREFPGSLFLGCNLSPESITRIAQTGGVSIPNPRELLFPVHRARLYEVSELLDSANYQETRDYAIYRQYMAQGGDRPDSILVSLARAIHDHSITDCLDEVLLGARVVAIMGGHDMERRDPNYRAVASLARTLTREGFYILTGGGPGAMEAAHFGAYMATRGDAEFDDALSFLGIRPPGAPPKKEYLDADWLARAMAVRERFPLSTEDRAACRSIGIATWLYGHEPPAAFATSIAKYFANSVREEGLLMLARHGVVYAPGSAGTTQEIFQDAAQNHYGTAGYYSPMILLGRRYWTEERPVWPLLCRVAQGQEYGELLALTDSEAEAVRRLRSYNPEIYRRT